MTSELPPFTCDPATKTEIWLFQTIRTTGQSNKGAKVYRRLPYNLVSYDGFRTRYIEPAQPSGFVKLLDGTGDPIQPIVDGAGSFVRAEYFDARPFEVFAINDVDVTPIGTLP